MTCARPVGRTSRRRLLLALAPTVVASMGILGGVAEGVVPASFTSGAPFMVTVEKLDSAGFGMSLGTSQGTGSPAVLTRWATAEATGLCQSSTVDLPVLGATTMVVKARTVHATDLVIDAYSASGQLNLQQMVIGPASGTTGYRAGHALLENITIEAGSATAGTFSLSGVELAVRSGAAPCRLP